MDRRGFRNFIRIVSITFILSLFFTVDVNASKKTLLKKDTYELCPKSEYEEPYWDEEYEEWVDYGEYQYDLEFSTNKKLFVVPMKIEIINESNEDEIDDEDYAQCTYGGLRMELINEQGKKIEGATEWLKGCRSGQDYTTWWWWSDFGAGKFTYRIINTSDVPLKVEISIIGYDSFCSSVKMNKKTTVKSASWKKIGKFNNAKNQIPAIKSIKSNKKGLIDGWRVKLNGDIYIYGNKPGTGTVTVTLNNGKKYKTKLTVTSPDPNFYAELIDYNTRNNYFTVRIKNVGIGNLTILSAGAYSMDVDYKSFDRKLYLSKNKSIVIKPGKTKKVKFKVKGSTTWYKYSDHTIRFYFKYYGKKRLCSVWDEDCAYKKGKKWYDTYWDEQEYVNWWQ